MATRKVLQPATAIGRREVGRSFGLLLAAPWVFRRSAVRLVSADFGTLGDGRADATAALNAAAAAIPDAGGVLTIPPGRYRLTGTLRLKSGTTLSGAGATLFAGDQWHALPAAKLWLSPGRALVANVNHDAAEITDHDIVVDGVAFEYTGATHGDAHAARFRKVRKLVVQNCSFSGGGDGTAFLACNGTEVANCSSVGTVNCAYDHWEGTSGAVVRDSKALCGKAYGILFTGAGTDPHDHEIAQHLIARNNLIENPSEAGIWVCSLSAKSHLDDVVIQSNTVVLNNSNGAGIGATGDVRNLRIEDNVIVHTRGGNALFTRPDKWKRPSDVHILRNRLVDCETADGNVALIQALGDRVEVQQNKADGGRYRSMVVVDGTGDRLGGNSGTGLTSRFKYNAGRARAPVIADP